MLIARLDEEWFDRVWVYAIWLTIERDWLETLIAWICNEV